MTTSSRPGRWRPRHLQYGPITDAHPADKREIARRIQRGQAVTDERLVAQALAYARFRARLFGVFGLSYLVLAAGEAVLVALGLRTVGGLLGARSDVPPAQPQCKGHTS